MTTNTLNQLVNELSQNEDVLAVVLAGSRKNGTSDEKSDYDIYVYYKNPISHEFRQNLAYKFAKPAPQAMFFDAFEDGDQWISKDDTHFDLMFRDRRFIEGNIEWVYDGGHACVGYSTACLFNFATAEILYDTDNWYKNLQDKINSEYPQKLKQEIIKKNFPLLRDVMSSYKEQIQKAVERNDLISVNHRTAAFLASYFDIIFATNEVYHPGEKKLIKLAKLMCNNLPTDFEENVNDLLSGKIEAIDTLVGNLQIALSGNM